MRMVNRWQTVATIGFLHQLRRQCFVSLIINQLSFLTQLLRWSCLVGVSVEAMRIVNRWQTVATIGFLHQLRRQCFDSLMINQLSFLTQLLRWSCLVGVSVEAMRIVNRWQTVATIDFLRQLRRPHKHHQRERTSCLLVRLYFLAYQIRFSKIFTNADKPYLTYPYPSRGIDKKRITSHDVNTLVV